MIAKRVALKSARKSDFAELASYLTDAQGNGARVGQVTVTNCEARTFEAAVAEVLATQRENTRAVSDKTYHLIVSFRTGEQPDEATLGAIEARLCDGLGYGEHQRISVVHRDTGNLHVHLAINKIHPARRTLHEPYRDHRLLGRLCEELEHDHALQRDNHLPRQHGAASRADDMQWHAGIDSLLGWIRRECLEAMQAAQSWTELHQVLHANGLELRVRGNGLVVAAGEAVAVKASSISRELSGRKLEARFGPFEPSPGNGEDAGGPVRQYRPQPGRAPADTASLYARYQAEQHDLAALRRAEGSRARDRKARLIEAARRRGRLKRAAIRLVSGHLARKVLYAATRRTLAAEIEQIRKSHLRERRQIQDRCKPPAWEPWLRARATEGDELARQALRAREAARGSGVDAAATDGHEPPTPVHMKRDSSIAAAPRFPIRFDGPRLEHPLPNLLPSASFEETSHAPSTAAVRGGADSGRPGGSRVPAAALDRARADAALHVPGGGIRGKPDLVRVGSEPPPQGRNRLRTLSELGVVRIDDGSEVLLPRHVPGHLEQQGAERADSMRRPVPRPRVTASASEPDAAEKYIAERDEKRRRGIDIPIHSRYSRLHSGRAEFAFAGIRRVEDQPLALLRNGEEIMVLPIDEATARRLGRMALGERLTMTPWGAIRARSRSR